MRVLRNCLAGKRTSMSIPLLALLTAVLSLHVALHGALHAAPIDRGSAWKFFPGTQEASSPDPGSWRAVDFGDGAWANGPAPFGYGEAGLGVDLGLLALPMQNNYSSVFLRQTVQVTDPAAWDQLEARTDYDDGFILWINGKELLRINVDGLPDAPVAFNALALVGHEAGIYEGFSLPDPAGYIVAGTNVVAVQVFNATLGSTDLKFDLEILDPTQPDVDPPLVTELVPPAGAVVGSITAAQVRFSEPVAGVEAADLLVNGVVGLNVSGSGAGPYSFSFNQPAAGPIQFQWAAEHGIADLAAPPNGFGGGGWSLTFDPNAPAGDVVINEFLALNGAGLQDEDGEEQGWIEVANRAAAPASLDGWALTDDKNDPARWIFPAVVLNPGAHLIVFASGKDRRPTGGGELHANFKLSLAGEYLGLLNAAAPRRVASEFSPRYPRQQHDHSYGISAGGSLVYLSTPTPGAANGSSAIFDGLAIEPVFSPGRGLYDAPVQVTLATATPGASIRYTLDGSEPTAALGTLYSGPVAVGPVSGRGAVALRAVAFKSGLLTSVAATHTYVFPESVLAQTANPAGFPATWGPQAADYAMDGRIVNDPGHAQIVRDGMRSIPTLSIVTHVDDLFNASRGIYANPSLEGIAWERKTSAEVIYPDGTKGFQTDCGIRVQGGSSTIGWKAFKVSLRLLFKGDYGATKLNYAFFPDSPVKSFDTLVLDAHLNLSFNHPSHDQRVRSQYVRDTFISDLQNSIGGTAPHDVFVHLYLNGLYWGLYDIHERPDAAFAASYFGGEKADYDALRHNSSNVVDGDTVAWNRLLGLARRDLTVAANYQALLAELDVDDLIDYMLPNLWGGNDDWAHQNWYNSRRREDGARWRFHSWDAEHVLKDVTIDRTGVNNAGGPGEVYSKLRTNPEFRLLFADHVNRHFSRGATFYVDPAGPAWDPANPERNRPAALYMRRIAEIDSAIACEAARWGDARRPADPYSRNDEWAAELNWVLTQYMPSRTTRVLAQFRTAGLYPAVGAPLLSQPGGRIQPGFSLAISPPAGTTGTIYYSKAGEDPRVPGTGAVSPLAEVYATALVLNAYTHLKARVLGGAAWSALTEAVFTLTPPAEGLRIDEIHYNPGDEAASEFIELANRAASRIDLSNVRFSQGVSFRFPAGSSLGAGERIVLVSDAAGFAADYPGVAAAGVFTGRLDNGGERVTVVDPVGAEILSVAYDDEGLWPIGPDGFGHSLVAADLYSDITAAEGWRASAEPGGSPGAPDPTPAHGGIVINEVLAHAAPPLEEAIELHNPTGSAIAIGGWYLSNSRVDAAAVKKFRIAAGTSIPAGGYRVFYQGDFGAVSPVPPVPGRPGFVLDDLAGAVYLASADGPGELTGFIVGAEYASAEGGVSFGRHLTSAGVDFWPQRAQSFGAADPSTVGEFRLGAGKANGAPLFGSVVINEIHYNPAAGEESGGEEFIELFNPSLTSVPLFDASSGRGWKLSGIQDALEAGSFEFAAAHQVPAQGFLLVVPIDPTVFRTLHAIPTAVPIAGPFGGGIDNGGETLSLLQPMLFAGGRVGHTPVDAVSFDTEDPWPVEPDGTGPSLERIQAASYGNEPANWAAARRPGGTPGLANTVSTGGQNQPPRASFTALPASGEAPLDVQFSAAASTDLDGAIVGFDWDFADGTTGAGKTVQHTFAAPGEYLVKLTVRDDDGAEDAETRLILAVADLGGGQVPGDGNQDGRIDLSDALTVLFHLFSADSISLPCDGGSVQEGGNRTLLDLDGSNAVEITDAIRLLVYLFREGAPPVLGVDCRPIPGCPDVCTP